MKLPVRTTLAVLLCLAALLRPALAAELPHFGARLQDLDAELAKAPKQTLTVWLPAGEGFKPNIKIRLEEYPKPLAEYLAQSKTGFAKLFLDGKWDTLAEKVDGDKSLLMEVTGFIPSLPDKKFHFYTRAFKQGTKVYAINATVLDARWPELGETIKRYVDSIKAE
jgi:hypothetical protein